MPPPQDRYEVNLELVTVAGTEYTMQANLSHYEDIAELEDDILCFLPTVSELDVFGCELELLNLQTQQPLPEAFRTELLHRPQLQIVVRPCMVDGHSIWQFFQDDGKESYPKAFMGCYVLRQVAAPGCVHYGQRVFAECCSLGSVGVKRETEDSSVLAPDAQLGRYAFESCLTLATVTFNTDRTNEPRALPEGAFCGAGIEQLCLPNDFHNIGPRACEN